MKRFISDTFTLAFEDAGHGFDPNEIKGGEKKLKRNERGIYLGGLAKAPGKLLIDDIICFSPPSIKLEDLPYTVCYVSPDGLETHKFAKLYFERINKNARPFIVSQYRHLPQFYLYNYLETEEQREERYKNLPLMSANEAKRIEFVLLNKDNELVTGIKKLMIWMVWCTFD